MKSGPTLKAWTVSPRRRNVSQRPRVTVVLPTPLATPATTSTRGELDDDARIPGPPAETGSWCARGAGVLASGSSYSPRLPGSRQWPLRVSSPVTVTGSRRIRTAFPGPSWAPRTQKLSEASRVRCRVQPRGLSCEARHATSLRGKLAAQRLGSHADRLHLVRRLPVLLAL